MTETDGTPAEQETVPPTPPLEDDPSLGEYFYRSRDHLDGEDVLLKRDSGQ